MRSPRVALVLACLILVTGLGAGRGTVDGLADTLAERARAALGRPKELDVAVAVTGPAPKLAGDLAQLLLARLRAGGLRSAARFDGDAVAARGAGFERLVRLQLEVAGGRLRATGAVVSLAGGLWGEPPQPEAHLYAELALDDELRAYLPEGAQGPWQARRLPLGDVALLALDVGDADGDGRPDLVGLTASELIGWGIEGGRAVERFRVRLEGRPAALRPRADVGTVDIEGGAVLAHASPFADGLRRSRAGAAAGERVRGYAFPGLAGACELQPGVDWFTGASCGASAAELPEKLWTAAALRRPGPRVVAAIVPGANSGTLWLRVGAEPPQLVPQVGAQVALGALDRGEVVATSEPAAPGEPDAVVIRGLGAGGPVLHRAERLGGNVRALAAGDVDGDGRAELLCAVRDDGLHKTDLWILH